ncbi:MAG: bifunctional 4-hydroxy-2-oxoglutarate aldolase/2-dehydro-3-deoxy-phosphogluconate aldolase [Gordonia sp. (in: high G+C Gram-positive bacteria)]
MTTALRNATDVMTLGPVIPVVVIDDASLAPDLARALLAGGVTTMEITLRTPAAIEAITAVAAQVPDMVVGAGTVTTADAIARSVAAGAQFLVSPGATTALLDAAASASVPLLPGAVTATEIMNLAERGITEMKFFPAATSGGASAIKALSGPFPDIRFCPTGGIGPADAPQYLSLPNVLCVGGSWLTPAHLVAAHDWTAITELARAATS